MFKHSNQYANQCAKRPFQVEKSYSCKVIILGDEKFIRWIELWFSVVQTMIQQISIKKSLIFAVEKLEKKHDNSLTIISKLSILDIFVVDPGYTSAMDNFQTLKCRALE